MWEQESGNTFAGGYLQYLHTILFTKIYICLLFVGCPVVGRSCNSSSELPEENSIISSRECMQGNYDSGFERHYCTSNVHAELLEGM